MTYSNIKSHKEARFHPLFRRYIFRKTIGGVKLTPPPPLQKKNVLGLKKHYNLQYQHQRITIKTRNIKENGTYMV